jgi:hypothetical protein
MTEIAVRPEQGAIQAYSDANLDRLERWAHQAVAARQIADEICGTSFVPAAYKGNPNEAAAAILAGGELGFSPLASLRAFHNIKGTPAPAAITLRAVVQSAGHETRIVESTASRCVMEGRRRGAADWQRVEWTIERAAQAGYVASNPKWKSDPTAQLVARATSELCRWIASDAIMGMPYSAEEITDTTGIEPTPAVGRIRAADIVQMAVGSKSTIDAIDAGEALSRIAHAATLEDLDRIKDMCQAAGLRDQDVLNAWTERYDELGGGAR